VTYVLYFAAAQAGGSLHCIGIVTSSRPVGPFAPSDVKVCGVGSGQEAIDPTVVSLSGTLVLVYKQDVGNDYSFKIQAIRLNSAGTWPASHTVPYTLIDNGNTRIEAPSMMYHGGKYWLFTSSGDWANCSYATQVWSATNSAGPFQLRQTVMSSSSTGLCGPGGAAVMVDGLTTRISFHAWSSSTSFTQRNVWTGQLRWSTTTGLPYLY
jgi:beta-xylosidase